MNTHFLMRKKNVYIYLVYIFKLQGFVLEMGVYIYVHKYVNLSLRERRVGLFPKHELAGEHKT